MGFHFSGGPVCERWLSMTRRLPQRSKCLRRLFRSAINVTENECAGDQTMGGPCATWVMDTLYIIVFTFGAACGLLLGMAPERIRMPTLLAMGAMVAVALAAKLRLLG
jgi:hypothetical protein